MAQSLGIEAFGGQEHDGEVGGPGGIEILVLDLLSLQPEDPGKGIGCLPEPLRITGLGGLLEAQVVLLGELGIDGQPYGALRVAGSSREADGELHHLGRALPGLDVPFVLPRGQELLQDGPELDLGPGAPGLHVGEDPLQVPHPGGQLLHLPQAPLDSLQTVAHQLERLSETTFQGPLELLVHGPAHLLQLLLILRLELPDAGVQGGADHVQGPGVGICELPELTGEGGKLILLLLAGVGQDAREGSAHGPESGGDLLPQVPGGGGRFLPSLAEVLLHRAPDAPGKGWGDPENEVQQHSEVHDGKADHGQEERVCHAWSPKVAFAADRRRKAHPAGRRLWVRGSQPCRAAVESRSRPRGLRRRRR